MLLTVINLWPLCMCMAGHIRVCATLFRCFSHYSFEVVSLYFHLLFTYSIFTFVLQLSFRTYWIYFNFNLWLRSIAVCTTNLKISTVEIYKFPLVLKQKFSIFLIYRAGMYWTILFCMGMAWIGRYGLWDIRRYGFNTINTI